MTQLSALYKRQENRAVTPRHFRAPGAENAACVKPRSVKGRRGLPTKTTAIRELVTCTACLALIGGAS